MKDGREADSEATLQTCSALTYNTAEVKFWPRQEQWQNSN